MQPQPQSQSAATRTPRSTRRLDIVRRALLAVLATALALPTALTLAMLQPEVLVSRAHQKFDRDGRLSDEATRKFLRQYLQTFYDWAIRILHGALIPR